MCGKPKRSECPKQNNRRPKPDAPMISSSANDRSRPTLLWGCLGGGSNVVGGHEEEEIGRGWTEREKNFFPSFPSFSRPTKKRKGRRKKNRLNESRAKEGAGKEKKVPKERGWKKKRKDPQLQSIQFFT
ncbi:hypothetical protein TNCT_425791 [Trichonephila clavata]|uniref:Uncharacterized protein n=1 Tax=Trichonephila clavata TaxID=2740835 RepID=A0A8X6GB69_TRICU|nr:hypothetical protein TNCT_425791 [Trichonephila clavata]